MSDRLLLATRNPGKLAELRRLLVSAVPGVEVIGLAEVPEYPQLMARGGRAHPDPFRNLATPHLPRF